MFKDAMMDVQVNMMRKYRQRGDVFYFIRPYPSGCPGIVFAQAAGDRNFAWPIPWKL